jgi:chromosome segregation ATPase
LREEADSITAKFQTEKAALMTDNKKLIKKVKNFEAKLAKFDQDKDIIVQLESDAKKDKNAYQSLLEFKNALAVQLATIRETNHTLEDQTDRLTIENSRLFDEIQNIAEAPKNNKTQKGPSMAEINKLYEEKMNLSQLLGNANAENWDLRKSMIELESEGSSEQAKIETLTGEKLELQGKLEKSWLEITEANQSLTQRILISEHQSQIQPLQENIKQIEQEKLVLKGRLHDASE